MVTLEISKAVASAAMAMCLVVALAGCSADTAEQPPAVGTAATAAGRSAPADEQEFQVGEFVRLGNFTVKVSNVQNPYRSKASSGRAGRGNKYVTVDVSIKNNSDTMQKVSSLMCVDLRDSQGTSADVAVITGTAGAPDGAVAPGRFIKGTLGFLVAKESQHLVLEFTCDLFSTDAAYVLLD